MQRPGIGDRRRIGPGLGTVLGAGLQHATLFLGALAGRHLLRFALGPRPGLLQIPCLPLVLTASQLLSLPRRLFCGGFGLLQPLRGLLAVPAPSRLVP